MKELLNTRPGQKFWGKKCQTLQWSLGQKVSAYQFLATSDIVLPRTKSSEVDHFQGFLG